MDLSQSNVLLGVSRAQRPWYRHIVPTIVGVAVGLAVTLLAIAWWLADMGALASVLDYLVLRRLLG